jgi:hypothetical protein
LLERQTKQNLNNGCENFVNSLKEEEEGINWEMIPGGAEIQNFL